MEKIIDARIVGQYAGHTCSAKGVIKLKYTFPYDELANYLKTFTMISNNVKIESQIPPDKRFVVGEFTIDGMKTNCSGETTITFMSTPDFVEMDNIDSYLYMDDMSQNIIVFVKAEITIEDEEENQEEPDNYINEAWADDEDSWEDDDENNNNW